MFVDGAMQKLALVISSEQESQVVEAEGGTATKRRQLTVCARPPPSPNIWLKLAFKAALRTRAFTYPAHISAPVAHTIPVYSNSHVHITHHVGLETAPNG